MFKLYVKTHTVTGLKYFGYTKSKDPHKYTGSGKYWLRHLKKHGFTFTTEIIQEFTNKQHLKELGQYLSKVWNIVDSNDWANLKEEAGDGGPMPVVWNKGKKGVQVAWNKGKVGFKQSEATKKKRSDALKGKKRSPFTLQHKLNMSKAHTGLKDSVETCLKKSESAKKKIFTQEHRNNLSKAANQRTKKEEINE
jgi:hypothetical protein